MIFIDYPPGGLGNFLAQCLTNTVNFDNSHVSFHRTKNSYYDRLTPEDSTTFNNVFANYTFEKNVAVIHSYGNLGLVRQHYPDSTIIQVVVDKEIAIFLNNLYRKAAVDNRNSERALNDHLIKNFNNESNAARRENYALSYLYWLNTPLYHNTPTKYSDIIINFDLLYQNKNSFTEEITKLTTTDVDKIYKKFVETQQIILDKVAMYQDIVNSSKDYREYSDKFDVIDHGLLCGMLQDKYDREFFLPNQEEFECII